MMKFPSHLEYYLQKTDCVGTGTLLDAISGVFGLVC
jgi:hypothetical protein